MVPHSRDICRSEGNPRHAFFSICAPPSGNAAPFTDASARPTRMSEFSAAGEPGSIEATTTYQTRSFEQLVRQLTHSFVPSSQVIPVSAVSKTTMKVWRTSSPARKRSSSRLLTCLCHSTTTMKDDRPFQTHRRRAAGTDQKFRRSKPASQIYP